MRLCGISSRFQLLSPGMGQVTHALLTRPPLSQLKIIRRINSAASLDLHVLSTPPAFILSQDQTLVKSVCIQFRINQLANSSLFTVVLVCLKTVLKNLLLKKFSRVVVVYCSVIKVLCLCRSFQATAFIFYQKLLSLSRTFLFFFVALFELSFAVSRDSLFRISLSELFVNNFFDLFLNHFIDF